VKNPYLAVLRHQSRMIETPSSPFLMVSSGTWVDEGKKEGQIHEAPAAASANAELT
jgi:hypothetical protein